MVQAPLKIPPRRPLSLTVCLIWSVGSAAVLLASLVLQIGPERTVVVPVINRALPETCAMYSRLGIDCPGCGLTRSFIHLSHGNVSAAWQLNAVGVFLYGFIILQLVLAVLHLLASLQVTTISRSLAFWTAINERVLIALAVALFGQWLIGFALEAFA